MSEARSLTFPATVEEPVDVLVVGGGSAGIAAATAAARTGVRTALVERYGFLGGTSTAGLVGPFMTSYSADGSEQVIAGLFQEMVDRMVALGGAIDPSQTEAGSRHASFIEYGHARVTPFHTEALKLAAFEMITEAGVRPRLHTQFVDANREGNTVVSITVLDRGGFHLLPARVVVDCSADAEVCVRSGAECTVGRPDGKMMPATMFMRIGGVDEERLEAWMEEHRRLHPGERLFECLVRAEREAGRWPIPREYINLYREPSPGEYRVNTTRLHGIDGTNADDLSRAEVEGRRQVAVVLRFLREKCPGCENVRLLETAAQIGIRETRHVMGDYVLTGEDVVAGRAFPDAIARCAYPADIHDPTGSRGTLLGPQETGAPYYEIPYRCLLPRGVEQLLVAGRCLSATHEGAASARVIPPCYATGEAAGTAAGLSVRAGVSPRGLDPAALQAALRAAGAIC